MVCFSGIIERKPPWACGFHASPKNCDAADKRRGSVSSWNETWMLTPFAAHRKAARRLETALGVLCESYHILTAMDKNMARPQVCPDPVRMCQRRNSRRQSSEV